MEFTFFDSDSLTVCDINLEVFPVDSSWKTDIGRSVSRSIYPSGGNWENFLIDGGVKKTFIFMEFTFFNSDFSTVCRIDLEVFPLDSAWKTGIETPISRSISPTDGK